MTARKATPRADEIEAVALVPVGGGRFLVTDGEFVGETVEFLTAPDGAIRFLRQHGRLHDPV